MEPSMSLNMLIFIALFVLCSCGNDNRLSPSEMSRISPQIYEWSERTGYQVLGVIPIKSMNSFSKIEKLNVNNFLNRYPHAFSIAKDAFARQSDEEWYKTMVTGNPIFNLSHLTNLEFSHIDHILRDSDLVKAWIIEIKKSNNYFGDIDSDLVIISYNGDPMCYSYYGSNAGASDKMCHINIFIPPDDTNMIAISRKNLFETFR